jgi:uncharacterized protein (DUF1499 family)
VLNSYQPITTNLDKFRKLQVRSKLVFFVFSIRFLTDYKHFFGEVRSKSESEKSDVKVCVRF